MWKVISRLRGAKGVPVEEIDSAETKEKAEELLAEYRIEFGDAYLLWIQNQWWKEQNEGKRP